MPSAATTMSTERSINSPIVDRVPRRCCAGSCERVRAFFQFRIGQRFAAAFDGGLLGSALCGGRDGRIRRSVAVVGAFSAVPVHQHGLPLRRRHDRQIAQPGGGIAGDMVQQSLKRRREVAMVSAENRSLQYWSAMAVSSPLWDDSQRDVRVGAAVGRSMPSAASGPNGDSPPPAKWLNRRLEQRRVGRPRLGHELLSQGFDGRVLVLEGVQCSARGPVRPARRKRCRGSHRCAGRLCW